MLSLTAIRQPPPSVQGDGLVLRCPERRDYHQWRDLRLRSRAFLEPYEPRWAEGELTQRRFAERVRRNRNDAASGVEFPFFIFSPRDHGGRLVGGLTLSNIRRRSAQTTTLGYWMGVDYAGKGIMKRAVALILPFVFDTLHLHRVEAACLPDNAASRRVLLSNGFMEIGLAQYYLRIDGAWRDHVLFGLTLEHYNGFAG
ncbi:GNAT family N-acetyltransferase [Pelagibacterium montanilacus]|uniref:GNAT family N-acetyltransferase n=1 Tax=Pelagibacterium montanilacus TaxID=2185280 RepID=UPI000F8DD681|nr:GNAT family protein [Pelagibacterium montanilacus]